MESSGKLASMVNAINVKANEVLMNFSVDPVKLPNKQAAPRTDLPGPLYVLFSQFVGIKAIYEGKLQVAYLSGLLLISHVMLHGDPTICDVVR